MRLRASCNRLIEQNNNNNNKRNEGKRKIKIEIPNLPSMLGKKKILNNIFRQNSNCLSTENDEKQKKKMNNSQRKCDWPQKIALRITEN